MFIFIVQLIVQYETRCIFLNLFHKEGHIPSWKIQHTYLIFPGNGFPSRSLTRALVTNARLLLILTSSYNSLFPIILPSKPF